MVKYAVCLCCWIMIFCVSGADKSLLAWYKLDGDFRDSSGNNYHLKALAEGQQFSKENNIMATPNTCWGPYSSQMRGSGAVGPGLPLKNSDGFTICGFVSAPTQNNYHAVLFGFGDEDHRKTAALIYSPYGVINTKVGSTLKHPYQRFADNRWHHFALVVPPDGAGDLYAVYVDGQEVYKTPVQRLKYYGIFSLGVIDGQQGDGLKIDEVKVFGRPLKPDEIKNEATLRGAPQTGEEAKANIGGGSSGSSGDIPRRVKPAKIDFPIQGKLKVHFLTRDWLCVVGDYNDFICSRIKVECGSFLKKLDTREIDVPEWKYDFHYNFAALEVMGDYLPMIQHNFEKLDYFKLQAGDKPVAFAENSYWLNAIGQMRVPTSTGHEKMVNSASMAHFAYLKPAEPLKNGEKYLIKTASGEEVSFVYDETKIISQALKVNQVGYLPDAGRKYAYLGVWLGPRGPLDLSAFDGKKFSLIDDKTDKEAFSGTINLRMKEQYYTGTGGPVPLNGEDVYEMDFAGFMTPGNYHIYVPGVGRSWSFEIGGNAIGQAYYTHIRGLFHQRSGIKKGPPHTNWLMGADHMESWEAGFSPNDDDYERISKDGYGYKDENGKPVKLEHFDVIEETATGNKLPEVHGGWWDAGDFDRRSYHFRIVDDLLSAYMMFPNKFPDRQLDIPESGNNIPDIIDEAAWGVELWRRAQIEKGGVACWLEATSHPKIYNPALDTQRYYIGLPTRWSTIQYAVYSAMLARAYKNCGAMDKAALYFNSAVRAFEYAMNPDNTVRYSWMHPVGNNKKVPYSFAESPELSKAEIFKAALNLYLYSGDKKYTAYLTQENFDVAIKESDYPRTPFFLMEIFKVEQDFFSYAEDYRRFIMREADRWLDYQEALAYRNLNWPLNHAYFRNLSWGGAIPFNKGRLFIAAYYLTGDKRYRDAALLLNDWLCGTNPMGRTFTSGLGKVFPVRFLSLPSYADGILEQLPGITIYTFTYRVNYNAKKMIYSLSYPARKDVDFNGLNVSLMPKAVSGGKDMSYDAIGDAMDKFYPVWRRFANIEEYAVDQNEFTVWETISPCAAGIGCLLPDNWLPPPEWKNRKPAEKLDDMEGYLFQP